MLLKDFIAQLQDLYAQYSQEDIKTAGEPSIHVDMYAWSQPRCNFKYKKFSDDIRVDLDQRGRNIIRTIEKTDL